MELITFEFEGRPIRVVIKDDKPLFVARDIARIVGYVLTYEFLGACGDDVVMHPLEAGGRVYNEPVIVEADIYRLVFRSDFAAAERFHEMMVSEISPHLRDLKQFTDQKPEKTNAQIIRTLSDKIEQLEQRMESLEQAHQEKVKRLEQEQATLKQKVAGFDFDSGYMTVAAFIRANVFAKPFKKTGTLGREAAKLCRAKGIPVGRVLNGHFGSVNSYPVDILKQALTVMKKELLENNKGPPDSVPVT